MAESMKRMFCFDDTEKAKTKVTEKFDNERFADLHFLFNKGKDEKKIPAHRIVLADVSDVFDQMLNGQWKKKVKSKSSTPAMMFFMNFYGCFTWPKGLFHRKT